MCDCECCYCEKVVLTPRVELSEDDKKKIKKTVEKISRLAPAEEKIGFDNIRPTPKRHKQ